MSFCQIKFEVNDNELLILTPTGSTGVYTAQTVITKEAFIECYKKWIVEKHNDQEDS